MVFFFSGTGNSKWIAQQIAAHTGENLVDLARFAWQSDRIRCSLDNVSIGLVFPVHAWRPPQIVRRFIADMPVSETPRYVWAVATCGDDVGRTPQILARLLARRGLKLRLFVSVQMPNTYVALPGFDVDSSALRRAKLHAAAQAMPSVIAAIDERLETIKCRPGAFPRFKSYVLGPLFERLLVSDRGMHFNSKCTRCGLCASKCPTQNIRIDENGQPRFLHLRCTMCLSCYHRCPVHAIEVGNRTLNKGQYCLEKHKDELA